MVGDSIAQNQDRKCKMLSCGVELVLNQNHAFGSPPGLLFQIICFDNRSISYKLLSAFHLSV